MLTEERAGELLKEALYQTSRSGGKGGQNVNKVETKVELVFNVMESRVLTEQEKHKVGEALPDLIEGHSLRITSSRHRSQPANREEVNNKLIELLNRILKPRKKRVPTKPSKASRLKKSQDKKLRSEKKALRQKFR